MRRRATRIIRRRGCGTTASSIRPTRGRCWRWVSPPPQTRHCRRRSSASSGCERGAMNYETIVVDRSASAARVTFNRPDVRNALNERMIVELTDAFKALSADDATRVVVLAGEGPAFSGGADINYMRAGLELGEQENYADALRLSDMFAALESCASPVIARVQGAALGGGSGLIAACDMVVAADDALFGFTEVRLGIVPAVISPFVLRKIGQTHARALFTTG